MQNTLTGACCAIQAILHLAVGGRSHTALESKTRRWIKEFICVRNESLSCRANNDPIMNESKGERHIYALALYMHTWMSLVERTQRARSPKESRRTRSLSLFWLLAQRPTAFSQAAVAFHGPTYFMRQTWPIANKSRLPSVILSHFLRFAFGCAHRDAGKCATRVRRRPAAWPKVLMYTSDNFA